MPDHFVQTYHDEDAKALNSEHSYDDRKEDSNTNQGVMIVKSVDRRNAETIDIGVGPSNVSDYRSTWRCQRDSLNIASDVPRHLYDLPGSTSNFVAYKYKSEATPAGSFVYLSKEKEQSIYGVASKDCPANTNFSPLEQENCSDCSSPTLWVSDEGEDSQQEAKDSGTSCPRQKDGTPQINDPSASNFNFPISVGEKGKAIICLSSIGLSSSYNSLQREAKLEELNLGAHLLQKMPACAVRDVERLRICTTVDSAEGVPGGPPLFSQATHHLLITKKAGVNLTSGDRGKSKLFKDFKGNALPDMLSLPSHYHDTRGPKLQFIGNSSSSERKEDTVDMETDHLKNGLSTETDTMDIDDCDTRNSSQGIASSPSNKDFVEGENRVAVKVGSRKTEIKIPDINHDPPAILAAKGSTGKRDLSTLRTVSLDVEHVSNVEQPEYLNTRAQQDVLEVQPGSRLVKRLKLSSSDSLGYGINSLRTGDGSSHEKVDKLFTKIMSYNIRSSEPTLSKHLGKKPMESDKSMVLFKNWESTSTDLMKEDKDFTLSHPWIQRWCHSQAKIKQAAPVICEPRVSKPTMKKQFLPSIAAMALMGKATNSFRSCEFRKRGPVVVWNTEGF